MARSSEKTDIIEALRWLVKAEEPIEFNSKQIKINSKTYKEPDYSEFSLSEINEAKDLLVDKLFSGQIDFKAEPLKSLTIRKKFNLITKKELFVSYIDKILSGSKAPIEYEKNFQGGDYIKNPYNKNFYSMFFKGLKNSCRNILNKSEYYCFNWDKGVVATKNILLPQKFLEYKILNLMLKDKILIGFIVLILSTLALLKNMDNLDFKYIYMGFASLFFLLTTVLFPYRNAYGIMIDINSLKKAIPEKDTLARKREIRANHEANHNIKETAEVTKNLTYKFDSFFNDFQKKHKNILSKIESLGYDTTSLIKNIQELVSESYENQKIENEYVLSKINEFNDDTNSLILKLQEQATENYDAQKNQSQTLLNKIKDIDGISSKLQSEIEKFVLNSYETQKIKDESLLVNIKSFLLKKYENLGKEILRADYIYSHMKSESLNVLEASLYYLEKINGGSNYKPEDKIVNFVNSYIAENENNKNDKSKSVLGNFITRYYKEILSKEVNATNETKRIKALIDERKIYIKKGG